MEGSMKLNTKNMIDEILYVEAIGKRGLSWPGLKKCMHSRFGVKITAQRLTLMRDYMHKLFDNGELHQITGRGLSGRFRLDSSIRKSMAAQKTRTADGSSNQSELASETEITENQLSLIPELSKQSASVSATLQSKLDETPTAARDTKKPRKIFRTLHPRKSKEPLTSTPADPPPSTSIVF